MTSVRWNHRGQPKIKRARHAAAALAAVVLALLTLGGLIDRSSAETTHPHLTVALPAGLSPRTIGFYLAQQEGYFTSRNITIDFITSTTETPSRLLADGKADLAVDLMPVALRLHQDGTAIRHVAQFFQHSSLALYCRPPISKPTDLHGTTIGVWFGGEESSFYAWMSELNISTFGEEDGVTVLRQGRVAAALADARLDCVTSTSYLAPLQMQASGIAPGSRKVFPYDDLHVGTLEDGLYARAGDLDNKDRVELFSRFLAASSRGWQKLHDDEASALRLLQSRSDLDIDQADRALDAGGPTDTGMSTATTAGDKKRTATVKADANKSGQQSKPVVTRPATLATGSNAADSSPAGKTSTDSGQTGTGQTGANQTPDSQTATGKPDLAALKASLDAVDALIDPGHDKIGALDADSYDRTVNLLLTGAPEPVLRSAPEDALSDVLLKHLRQTATPAKP